MQMSGMDWRKNTNEQETHTMCCCWILKV